MPSYIVRCTPDTRKEIRYVAEFMLHTGVLDDGEEALKYRRNDVSQGVKKAVS
ncbi:hypothetical protein EYZ11_005428 [Aspergillus tanneri]|uniref:Uncharacterized protein n=1 Tax=Aspergillus tanneri TaxID=1220188 RepID=A0A4V3UPG4_9EURO|nr:hypothetical protein EYZ11_005428 [Aspergillus tanneri]